MNDTHPRFDRTAAPTLDPAMPHGEATDKPPTEPTNAHDRKHYYHGMSTLFHHQEMEKYYRQRADALQDMLHEFLSQTTIDEGLRNRGLTP